MSTNPIPMDGTTEVTVTMSYSGDTATLSITHDGNTETYTGTFTDPSLHISDFVGSYCTIEHYCEGDRNTKAMPMFTYWEVSGTGFKKAKDFFLRENGSLNTTPTGQNYVQISNVYNDD